MAIFNSYVTAMFVYHKLQSNVYFVLARPYELQLHVRKELDQIPFSKCLKSWVLGHFVLMHACFAHEVFFSERFHPQASERATVDQ